MDLGDHCVNIGRTLVAIRQLCSHWAHIECLRGMSQVSFLVPSGDILGGLGSSFVLF